MRGTLFSYTSIVLDLGRPIDSDSEALCLGFRNTAIMQLADILAISEDIVAPTRLALESSPRALPASADRHSTGYTSWRRTPPHPRLGSCIRTTTFRSSQPSQIEVHFGSRSDHVASRSTPQIVYLRLSESTLARMSNHPWARPVRRRESCGAGGRVGFRVRLHQVRLPLETDFDNRQFESVRNSLMR